VSVVEFTRSTILRRSHRSPAPNPQNGLQEVFPDEAADKARGSVKLNRQAKQNLDQTIDQNISDEHSKGELRAFGTVLPKFATRMQQNETFRSGDVVGSDLESVKQ